ncbi:Uncharacterised protein [Vibrio cholerae]|uniref:Uncharacterized protein n=1 Tax=Vibrio cholerae TaxID=666 RepID=A0A655RZS7_VIBCL|nr:Uncharacterised protein [Vibrio cholerae]CSB14711.1 Uncharacterised protein [Vibrio cholerae]CSB51608.1 Uncharacterised protein [Vibrio cholerae]CSB61166.1 Uncharacterised protein [Vibrio cholerae]CSB78635.1 Uncharacterised protein [Vibrio cholerae]
MTINQHGLCIFSCVHADHVRNQLINENICANYTTHITVKANRFCNRHKQCAGYRITVCGGDDLLTRTGCIFIPRARTWIVIRTITLWM